MENKSRKGYVEGATASQQISSRKPLQNWAGNLIYSTSDVHYPTTVDEVQEVVVQCNKLRVLG